jgi:iron complex outermembrane receptor protein
VLALIDGLPVLSTDAGNIKWQFLPFENLSQIEIIKGASSVLYGSSALNGIINFRTEDASNTPSTRFFAETGIFGKPAKKEYVWWDTPRVFSSLSFSHLRKAGNNDIGVSMNLMADEGYRRLNGEKLARINIKLKHFSNKLEGLTYGLNINSGFTAKKDFVLWEDAYSGALKQSATTASDFRGDFIAFDPYIAYKKTGSFQHDLRMRAQSSRNRNPDREQNNSDALSMYSEYQLWIKLNRITDLTAGAGINMVKVNSPFFGDHTAGNQAGFAQFELKPFSKLKAVAGVRVERFSLDRTEDKTVPIFRAGLNFHAAEFTWLRASFGQGFRYPSIAEKFAATTLGSIIIIANPSLLSESGWSSEAGIKQGLSLGKFSGQTDLSAFYTRNSNLIEYMFGAYPEGIGFRAANNEESLVWGTELEILLAEEEGKLRSMVSAAWTYINPLELNPLTGRATGEFLKYRRKHSVMFSWSASTAGFDFGLNFYYRSKILAIDDVFLTTPILPGFDTYWPEHNTGYVLFDGSAGYRLNQHLKLSFAVKNITNTEYMGRPGDIQPHRNYSLRLSGSF